MPVSQKYASAEEQREVFKLNMSQIRYTLKNGGTIYDIEDTYGLDPRFLVQLLKDQYGDDGYDRTNLYRKRIYIEVGNYLRHGYRTDTIAKLLPITQYELSEALNYEKRGGDTSYKKKKSIVEEDGGRILFDQMLYKDKKIGEAWRQNHHVDSWPDYYLKGVLIGREIIAH